MRNLIDRDSRMAVIACFILLFFALGLTIYSKDIIHSIIIILAIILLYIFRNKVIMDKKKLL